jgi:3-oxoadipate CoA-transferase alpha subunit
MIEAAAPSGARHTIGRTRFCDTVAQALDGARDGMTVMVGGFGSVGQPDALIDGLIDTGVGDLTIVANNAGAGRVGLARLLELGRVRRVVCSYPRSPGSVVFEELYDAGRIELEVVPQGTLAERIRAAGAGVPAFFTRTGAGTLMAQGKEQRTINGKLCVLEMALHADLALIDAWRADRAGNLVYRASARNFNPIMAMAADLVVAQARMIEVDAFLDPEAIVTPGLFVDRVVAA